MVTRIKIFNNSSAQKEHETTDSKKEVVCLNLIQFVEQQL